jgi:hypothetical protein
MQIRSLRFIHKIILLIVPIAYRGQAQIVTGKFSDLLFDYQYTYVVAAGVAYTCPPITVFDEVNNSKNPVSRSVSTSFSVTLTAQAGWDKIASIGFSATGTDTISGTYTISPCSEGKLVATWVGDQIVSGTLTGTSRINSSLDFTSGISPGFYSVTGKNTYTETHLGTPPNCPEPVLSGVLTAGVIGLWASFRRIYKAQ